MIRPPIPPQQRLHEVTATPKITPKEITWDRMGLSNDPQSVLASNGKEKSNHRVIFYDGDTSVSPNN